MRKRIYKFDADVTAWIQSWPKWLYQPMLAITNVGQPLTVILLAVGLIVWAVWQGREQLAIASSIVLVTIIVASILKLVLRRARPVNDYVKNMILQTFSFPSGHAAAATVGFGFFAYLVAITMPDPWNWVIALSLVVFSLLVGISRIYLGAHYPSDVVGGIFLGIIGLVAAVLVITPLT